MDTCVSAVRAYDDSLQVTGGTRRGFGALEVALFERLRLGAPVQVGAWPDEPVDAGQIRALKGPGDVGPRSFLSYVYWRAHAAARRQPADNSRAGAQLLSRPLDMERV